MSASCLLDFNGSNTARAPHSTLGDPGTPVGSTLPGLFPLGNEART
ncbi:protein of unknown function [Candidatus Methylocalor cossyra]|uniref:Uncharacterized protein n=1 Tax=Candidatus Methylocalor cossyra TaxID=3108543 RepID=A0ABM9NEH7_9GAMM